jgi:hypothetical protein
MATIEKYEHAKFVIERFDHYYDCVNNKGTFYVGLNTFLLGGLFIGFVSLYQQVAKPQYLWILLISFAICSVISTVATILAINPFLLSGNKKSRNRSLIFFGSVAEYQKENYADTFLKQDNDRILTDTVTQTWFLARGLDLKYKRLKVAGYLLIAQFVLLVPIIYCITKNLISHEHI